MSVKVALLGFGTVASGIPLLLENNSSKIRAVVGDDLVIAKVLVRDETTKKRLLDQGYSYQFVTSIDDIVDDESIDMVVELMGRIEPAKTFISRALSAGKPVVTANKDLIALYGGELSTLAAKHQVALYYEAAVAGGIPILRALADSFASDKLTRLLGVLNGTTNFMLTKMIYEGWTYEMALQKAQELGYAESDPTNDVKGIDAAYKVAILSQFAFGMTIDFEAISYSGIDKIRVEDVTVAQKLGYVIKLVGLLEETASGLNAEVSPVFLPKTHPLAAVDGVMNAVYIESIGVGQAMFYGPGAGQMPTATAVVADMIQTACTLRDHTAPVFNRFATKTRLAKPEDIVSSYYFAIQAANKAGQLLELTRLCDVCGIRVEQLLSDEIDSDRLDFVMITHEMSKKELVCFTALLQDHQDFRMLSTFKILGD
ncbi:TPA: homoserine dehydrogenase [Streptococcus equi subsp. zooepidemicus]|uniref:homoserine dehydrogenase n=1 Tax=Streptococcus equi TaxID=1336 RepID=UPI001E5AF5C0|nr:homoserine dehydrogenase [Streptococcus equi]MCD3373910.1 homoserine dehydrogenase [Streptococcus equi subsp. zooepidemicus]MDI5951729.1 homoserine dehydrogenase [Streptococcus equi subsp. zooepidemicus]MDI6073911.1 homoserine dehydrogenase [Streptococcus equi subsp. zooepidemicus]HEK9954358.1 homoserine dehydrogenase [Streptococcus equi subsp. zooepidemicus]HEK9956096.1 homoserine dehydrogenase [Streptococcus equi subsp. zooepidemicus]